MSKGYADSQNELFLGVSIECYIAYLSLDLIDICLDMS